MLKVCRPDKIIRGQVGRADADDVAVARVIVDIVRPCPPGAASRYVDDFNRDIDESPFLNRSGNCARYTVEAASRGRSGDDPYRSLGFPGLRRAIHTGTDFT